MSLLAGFWCAFAGQWLLVLCDSLQALHFAPSLLYPLLSRAVCALCVVAGGRACACGWTFLEFVWGWGVGKCVSVFYAHVDVCTYLCMGYVIVLHEFRVCDYVVLPWGRAEASGGLCMWHTWGRYSVLRVQLWSLFLAPYMLGPPSPPPYCGRTVCVCGGGTNAGNPAFSRIFAPHRRRQHRVPPCPAFLTSNLLIILSLPLIPLGREG